MAEVMKFEDFKEEGSEAAAKVRSLDTFSSLVLHLSILFFLSLFFRPRASIASKVVTTSWRTETSSSSSSTPAPDSLPARRSKAATEESSPFDDARLLNRASERALPSYTNFFMSFNV